ncbi:WD40 repeat-like protein [Pisolithus croceorrhizus]|nr:WD40 repeat-like protein [Pisolithus croceorrhizus]
MAGPMTITAEEVNCLIHAYFQDSGFQHSAFTLRMEGRLDDSHHIKKHIPRGELVELLSKALLYSEVEAHWKEDGLANHCKNRFSLLEHHVCSFDSDEQSHPSAQPNGGSSSLAMVGDTKHKRKSVTPSSEDGHVEKRARREDDDSESAMAVDGTPKTIPKEVKSLVELQPSFTESVTKKHKTKGATLPESEAVSVLRAHKSEVFVASWNPASPGNLITGARDATIMYWDIPTNSQDGSVVSSLPPTSKISLTSSAKADLTSLDWNKDGTLVAIGSLDSVLRICNASGKTYLIDDHHKGPIFAAKFSPSGQWIVTASLDNTSCVWDVKDRRLHRQYRNHGEACCLDVDWIDDSIFVTSGGDCLAHIVSLSGTKPIQTLKGHTAELTMVKCNPSRTRLVSGSDDATARIWNLEAILMDKAPTPIILKGHTKCLTSVKWCPYTAPEAHELVVTASFDMTVRLWDSVTGDCLRVLMDHTKPVYSLSFSPEGFQLATGGGDGYLHLYDVKVSGLLLSGQRKLISIKTGDKVWSWSAGVRLGIFEIDWKKWGDISRIALATEHRAVVIVDPTKLHGVQRTT